MDAKELERSKAPVKPRLTNCDADVTPMLRRAYPVEKKKTASLLNK
ncbi:MAG: hypothetical protein RL131_184 [Bacteroidota bacterium]